MTEKTFPEWWETHRRCPTMILDEDEPRDFRDNEWRVRAMCGQAFYQGALNMAREQDPRLEDSYQRGRRSMLVSLLIGACGAGVYLAWRLFL